MVLTDAEYTSIPGITTAVTAPTWPGTLTIPATANAVQAVHARELHQERIRLYRECQNVEKALLNHLQRSLEPKYLESFVDESTALLTGDIPDILDHLFSRYGTVSGEEVKNKEVEVLKTAFTPSDPLVLIWNPIEKLKRLAIQANLPYTEPQLISFALQIIRNTHDFEIALGEWNQKPAADKTWENLKSHFYTAQENLKKIRGPTMAQAGFHQINMIANDIRDEFTLTRSELANLVAALDERGETENEHNSPPDIHDMANEEGEFANAAQEANVQLEMLKLLRNMQNEIVKMNNKCTSVQSNGKKKKTPDNPSFTRRTTNMYCWTHGGCAHGSAACKDKAPGHKNEATFENKMGGSKAFCP